MTAEDLWLMPEQPGKQFELVNGDLIETPGTGASLGWIVGVIFHLIRSFVLERHLGVAFGDNTSYVLRRNPDAVRVPDSSYVSWPNVPPEGLPAGYWPQAPDLAVEVVSPNDPAREVHQKVHEYLDAGSRVVWVLWSDELAATIYEQGGAVGDIGPEDILDGGDVLPEFRVRAGDLFEGPVRP